MHPSPRRLEGLDGVRGIAICAVVAFHTAVMATRGAEWLGERPPPAPLWPVFAGKLGVDVFFVLSGFLVLRSWTGLRARRPHKEAVQEFVRRRARRILPAYWFSLLVLVPLRTPQWLTSFDGLQQIVVFASLQQFMDPQLPHQLNVVTWSLTTEAHFYVLLPALAWAMVRFGARNVVLAALGLSIAWRLLHGGTGEEAEWIVGRIDQFVAGMAAATLVKRHEDGARSRVVDVLNARWSGVALWGIAIGVSAPLGVMQLLPKPLAYQATFHAVIGVVLAAWLIRAATRGIPRIFENRALRGLGDVSYSLYLWHWPILIEASARWGPTAPVLAGALVVTAVMTAITYLIFERPFTKSRRTLTPTVSSEASSPTAATASGPTYERSR